MQLEHLAEVHSAGHAQGVEHDVDRGAVREEWHILFRKDPGDDTLVAVTAGELVSLGDLAMLGDVDANHLVHAVGQLVTVLLGILTRNLLDGDNRSGLTVRHPQ